MRILTRLPSDLHAQLRGLDLAAGVDVDVPPIPEMSAAPVWSDAKADSAPDAAEPVTVVTEVPPRRRRRALAAVAVLAAAAAVAGFLVADWHGDVSSRQPAGGPTHSSPTGHSAAVKIWGPFPADQTPRPIVLMSSDIDDPARGFPNSDSKLAYLAHRIQPTTSLPTSPAQADGYQLRTAAAAVAELGGATDITVANSLTVTRVTLTEHSYATDRGYRALPAWAVQLGGIADPAYVLAVGAHDLFNYPAEAHTPTGPSGGTGIIAARGNQLTFAFTPTHTSTGLCDSTYSETVALDVRATVVVLTITRIVEPPTGFGGASCPLSADPGIDSLVPGAPNTKTVTTGEDLGNRPVVNGYGTPWVVTVLR